MNMIIPNHIAMILDGNGRWATKRGLSRSAGHLEGSKTLIKLVEHVFKKGVKVFSVFVFSTENFKRDKKEVDYLMNLFIKMFKTKFNKLKKENIKIVFSGRRNNLLPEIVKSIEILEEETKGNDYILNICLNYGGQTEIVDATKKIIESNIDINDLSPETYKKYLYNDLPDIDLMIRTGGERRISNFMLFLLAYSELYFTDVYFPDFNGKELDKAIIYYNSCERRFGGNSTNNIDKKD